MTDPSRILELMLAAWERVRLGRQLVHMIVPISHPAYRLLLRTEILVQLFLSQPHHKRASTGAITESDLMRGYHRE